LTRRRGVHKVGPIPRLSLFDDDPFRRVLVRLRIDGRNGEARPFRRALAGAALAWPVTAALAWLAGVALGPTPRESFLVDVAAFFQYVVVMPLLLAAEPWIDSRIRDTGEYLVKGGIVPAARRDDYDAFLRRVAALRRSAIPGWACALAAYAMMASWLVPELGNGYSTWHAAATGGGERPTLPGLWAALVAIPLVLFAICRWAWKVCLWAYCLYRISRFDLRVVPVHPDSMGGLGFLGALQGRFGTVIFAVGVLIAATTYHRVVTEGAPLGTWATWAPVAAYVLLAPAAFAAPLLFFTASMSEAKRKGEQRYAILLAELSHEFHARWLGSAPYSRSESAAGPDFGALADAGATFQVVRSMRIVPFDYRTIANLALSAGLPMVPVFLKLLPLPEPVRKVLDLFA
jgi:hypothetical protein